VTDDALPTPAPIDKSADYFDTTHLESNLRRRSIRGGTAIVISQACRFAIGMAGIAALGRLLSPPDFGLVAMVAILIRFVTQFKDLGLTMATVQRPEITHQQVSTLFWVNSALGLAVAGFTMACAPLVAWFYDEPRLVDITLVLAIAFAVGGFGVQHQALLRRQMRFGALAAVSVCAKAVGVTVAIYMAMMGRGYWALVVMSVAIAVATTSGMWVACNWRPGRPTRTAGVGSMLAFGGSHTVSTNLNIAARNVDKLLLGLRTSADVLGFYSKAVELILDPIRQVNMPMGSVAVTTLSRLQDQPERFAAFYRRGVQLLASITLPLVAAVVATAHDLVPVVLGDQWDHVIPLVQILGLGAMFQALHPTLGWVLISTGRADRLLRWMVVSASVRIGAMFVGIEWGVEGMAIAVSAAMATLWLPATLFCYRPTPVRTRDQLSALWRPAIAAAVSGAAGYLTAIAGSNGTHWLGLLIALPVIGLAYLGTYWILPGGRRILNDMWSMVDELKGERVEREVPDEGRVR
jgi:PST family polysaccharide transporter